MANLQEAGFALQSRGKEFKASTSWLCKWLVQEGHVSRKKTNKRKTTVDEMLSSMTFWCRFMRQVVLTTPMLGGGVVSSSADSSSGQMGSYPLTKRLNVDQVPFNLLSRESRTYVPYTECAHVVIPGATPTEKRFGTLQVCSAAVDPQPPLSIVFRGKRQH